MSTAFFEKRGTCRRKGGPGDLQVDPKDIVPQNDDLSECVRQGGELKAKPTGAAGNSTTPTVKKDPFSASASVGSREGRYPLSQPHAGPFSTTSGFAIDGLSPYDSGGGGDESSRIRYQRWRRKW